MIDEEPNDLYGDESEPEPTERNRLLRFVFGKLSEPKTAKLLKRVLPHTAIMIAVFVYTIGGGYIFYLIEHPYRSALLEKASTTVVADSSIQTSAIDPGASDSTWIATSAKTTTSFGSTSFTTTIPITRTVETVETVETTKTTIYETTVSTVSPVTQSYSTSTTANGTTTTAATNSSILFRQKRQEAKSEGDDEEDEEEVDPEKQAKKKCTRHILSGVVERARKACVSANAPNVKDKADEFRAHLCVSLLAQLSACITKPGFRLEDIEEEQTTTKMPTTTKMSTTTKLVTAAATTTSAPPTAIVHKQCESAVKEEDLTPSSYIFMAFTIISTIGYGHVAPVSMWGRLFCIFYGLFGIPLALLAIADQGRFLSAAIMFFYKKLKSIIAQRYTKHKRRNATASLEQDGGEEDEESMPALLLLILFGAYLLIGGAVLTPYEKGWTYIDAVYFTFISSSSIGFGDLLPQDERYLPLTLFYVALGLALSTAAIDVFAGYLRRLHHWGTKLRNCANKLIWFGGQRVTLTQLVRNIGVQLGVPEDKINHLVDNFDEVVVTTIQQVESGLPITYAAAPLLVDEPAPAPEIKLPKSGPNVDIDFIDEKNEQAELH